MRIYERKNKKGEIISYCLELSRTERYSLKTKDKQEAFIKAAALLDNREKESKSTVVELKNSITLNKFFELYISSLEADNYSTAHIRNHKIALTYLIQAIHGSTPLRNINANHFEEYKRFRLKLGHKISYINTDIKKVRSAFGWAVYKNFITKNPFVGGKPIRERGKVLDDDLKFMLPSHVNQLRQSLESSSIKFSLKTGKQMWRDMLECFLYTGARRHEIVRLDRKDIDFISGKITLRDYKNDKTNIVTIHDKLRPVLIRLVQNKRGRIFDVTVNHTSNMFTKIMEEANLNQFVGTHIFRYTVISLLICEGCTAEQVALAVGHATPDTTMKIYAKIHTEYKKEIFNKLPY
jgi:integrase